MDFCATFPAMVFVECMSGYLCAESHTQRMSVLFSYVQGRWIDGEDQTEIAWVTFRRSDESPKKCSSKISDDISMSASYVLCILERSGAVYVRRPHTQTHNHFFSIPLFFIIHIVVCVSAIFLLRIFNYSFCRCVFCVHFPFFHFLSPAVSFRPNGVSFNWFVTVCNIGMCFVCVWYMRSDANVYR